MKKIVLLSERLPYPPTSGTKNLLYNYCKILHENVVIVDHDHNYKVSDRKNTFTAAPIHIGNNVWIGANVTIMKGTSIGEGSVIGAGVVLKGEYPANTVIYEKADIVMRPIERKKKDE